MLILLEVFFNGKPAKRCRPHHLMMNTPSVFFQPNRIMRGSLTDGDQSESPDRNVFSLSIITIKMMKHL